MNPNFDDIATIKKLILRLLRGDIDPADFQHKIIKFNQTKVWRIFRDLFPNFNNNLKNKIVTIFRRFFLGHRKDKVWSRLWKFVSYKEFWVQLYRIHEIYDRDWRQTDVITYFERMFSQKAKITLLEQKIISKIEQSKTYSFRDIAKELKVSEKTVTEAIKSLRRKGIYLGSFVNFSQLGGLHEYFVLGEPPNTDSMVFKTVYSFFPFLKFTRVLSTEKISNSNSFYKVISKKMITNLTLLFNDITFEETLENNSSKERINQKVISRESMMVLNDKECKEQALTLAFNCQENFKQPKLKYIAEDNDISVRTMIRLRKKLVEQDTIIPAVMIKTPSLSRILIISKHELTPLYSRSAYIEAYKVLDNDQNNLWMTFVSIFIDDLNTFFRRFQDKNEMYLCIDEMTKKMEKGKKSPAPIQTNNF